MNSLPHRFNHCETLPSRAITSVVLVCICLFCLSCGPLSSRIVYDPGPAVARLQLGQTTLEAEVDGLAQPLIASQEATCLEIGVLLPDGSMHAYGYGKVDDTGPSALPDQDTIFQVGSVSKLFTSSILELLVQEGRISYSDTVRDILPKDAKLSPDMGKVTIFELATHTSGLPREPVTFKQFMYFMDYEFTGKNLYGYINDVWLGKYLATCKISDKSHKFIYSNIGYGILAYLIEVKTGRSFQDLVAEQLLAPLGMSDTVFSLSKAQAYRQALGHVGDQPYFMKRNSPMKAWDMGAVMAPSGGIYSTVADLLTFAKHTLALEASPLDPVLLKTTEPMVGQADGESTALGWTIAEAGADHARITYKHGMASGYSAYIGMNMAKKLAVVVLCSSFNWKDKIGQNLLVRLSACPQCLEGRPALRARAGNPDP